VLIEILLIAAGELQIEYLPVVRLDHRIVSSVRPSRSPMPGSANSAPSINPS
jgi:hypothetical protein